MSHILSVRLVRREFDPVVTVRCFEPTDAPCHDYERGELDDIGENQCQASTWLETCGVYATWAGADDINFGTGPIDVQWDGADWLWKYPGQAWAELDVDAKLDRVEVQIMDLNLDVDAAHAHLDEVETALAVTAE